MKMPQLDGIVRWLESEEWPVEVLWEASSVRSSFEGEHGEYRVIFRTREDVQEGRFHERCSH